VVVWVRLQRRLNWRKNSPVLRAATEVTCESRSQLYHPIRHGSQPLTLRRISNVIRKAVRCVTPPRKLQSTAPANNNGCCTLQTATSIHHAPATKSPESSAHVRWEVRCRCTCVMGNGVAEHGICSCKTLSASCVKVPGLTDSFGREECASCVSCDCDSWD